MTWTASLRPDALALVRVGERSILIAIERDLGTERGPILAAKVENYQGYYDGATSVPRSTSASSSIPRGVPPRCEPA